MLTLPLNSSWKFRKLPGLTLDHLPDMLAEGSREELSLPHTWYRDEDPYQGLAVYEKTVGRNAEWKKAFLSFDAADQSCRVFVNGHFAGGHRGGYSRFRLPVPEAVMSDTSWTVQVFLENALNEDIAPSFGDFTVFGGLYRHADLLICGENHFDY